MAIDRLNRSRRAAWQQSGAAKPGELWCCSIFHWMIQMKTFIVYRYHTSSTAQGGGGSFKDRKPIGEFGCCDAWLAEQIRWWTEKWLELCFLEWLQWWLHPQLLDVTHSLEPEPPFGGQRVTTGHTWSQLLHFLEERSFYFAFQSPGLTLFWRKALDEALDSGVSSPWPPCR